MSGGDWTDLDRAELERRHREACELLVASEQQVGRLARELEKVRGDAETLAQTLSGDLDRERRQLADRAAELATRDAQLADVVASASWRITRPLRSLKSRLRERGA